jgi:phage/plasmid-like protein (TIGR03299 family)
MAHEISFIDGKAEMAFVGQVPWHGLGQSLTLEADMATWRREAGFNWVAKRSPVHYVTEAGDQYYMDDRDVLYRSDNDAVLGIVSDGYQIVQPGDVMDFFESVINLGNFQMETAGVLFGGKRLWALARANSVGTLGKDDPIKPFLLLATSMDQTLATTAMFTTVRVVCNNTLGFATKGKEASIKLTHRGKFNADKVKTQLGLVDDSFDRFMAEADLLASKPVSAEQARDYYGELFLGARYTQAEEPQSISSNVLDELLAIRATMPGADTLSARDTAWGLVNGVTYYLDHARNTQTVDARLNHSWFGPGNDLKRKAVELALEL